MSDQGDDQAAPIGVDSLSAGALLRAARERRGLHIAALAASIKVSPRKLEALEADRYSELPDLTFTRALAHTVCRALKVDAEPVLAKLPHGGDTSKLVRVGGSLNAPFRGARGSRDPSEITFHRKPVFWITLLILLGALALALAPERWMVWRHGAAAAASAAAPASITAPSPRVSEPVAAAARTEPLQAASGVASTSVAAVPAAPLIETVHSSPQAALAGSPGLETAGILAVQTSAETWVEVKDARGQMLMSRSVQPGELVGLDGALPLRLIIGNASATRISFRGKPVDLASSTRDNVARLQLP
jgi:cytoskeleton protein RodZ